MKNILKNPRILIWLFFIIVSLLLISPKINPQGFVVTGVDPNSPGAAFSTGDVVYSINGERATADTFLNQYHGIVQLDTSKGSKFVNVNGSLGLTVDSVPSSNLKFGLDLKGGVHAIIEPNETSNYTIDQIISTLQTRINVYGLREAIFRPAYSDGKGFVEISIAGGTREELQNLIESQGKFDARVPLSLQAPGQKTSITLDKKYDIMVAGDVISVGGNTVHPGESFSLAGTDFVFNGLGNGNVNLTSQVFTGNDIVAVFFDPQRSRIDPAGNGYRWTFGVQLSPAGAQRFAWVTQNTNALQSGSLDQPIIFYLDNRYVDSLSIASGLKGRVETEISISGPGATMQDAVQTRSQLQSILRSGALPTSVRIVQLDTISPTLGTEFLKNAALAGAAAILGVIVIVSIRYRKPKLVLPMLAISLSEVLMVLGFAAVTGWNIDLAAIAGIIASVGTGINSQIIILDRTLRKEEERLESTREKMKKAFFVIFGSAGTVIAAMLPLLVLGFGLLRGFALVTMVGVLVGVLIARPAYGAILESIVKD